MVLKSRAGKIRPSIKTELTAKRPRLLLIRKGAPMTSTAMRYEF